MKKGLFRVSALCLVGLVILSGCSLFGEKETDPLEDADIYIRPYIALITQASFNLEETPLTANEQVELCFASLTEKDTASLKAKEFEKIMANHLGLDAKGLEASTYYSSSDKVYSAPADVDWIQVDEIEILEETNLTDGVQILFTFKGSFASLPDTSIEMNYRWVISEKNSGFVIKSGERVSSSVG